MITCFLKYEIDASKLAEFEHYGRLWISLVNRLGGSHHGYLMPSEGANDIAYASFSFPNFAAYETYRAASFKDPACQAAFAYGTKTQCIKRYERSFLRPVFEGL
jgi:NIPSNAP